MLAKSKKSVLLLGPRQTGKSTLMRGLDPDLTINLMSEQTYLDFARNPSELSELLKAGSFRTVFIDEVQRLPSLLNTVQAIIDEGKGSPKFLLTGSSARKLKRGQANLLPGRIHTHHLWPLSVGELDHSASVRDALETGMLPGIYTERDKAERMKTLRSYSATYLREEVQAGALTRNLEGFSRFLFVAASCSGHFLDFAKLAGEAQVPRQSAIRFFEILEDTLIVNRCPPFTKSDRKRLVRHPKFYFFDTGVLNAALGNFEASDDRKGLLFEHLFFNQLLASASNADVEMRISTYRTEHGAEVDFIVEIDKSVWAVELKASRNLGPGDLRGLKNFADFYGKRCSLAVAYMSEHKKNIDGVGVFPWQKLIEEMGL